jgi:hypothetical protein
MLAEVECLFLSLDGIQGVKRSCLTVPHFEALGKLHSNYPQEIYKKAKVKRNPAFRKHVDIRAQTLASTRPEEIEAEFAAFLPEEYRTWIKEARLGDLGNADRPQFGSGTGGA